MIRQILQKTTAIAALALFAIGAKAQVYTPYPSVTYPYQNAYGYTSLAFWGGGYVPLAITPSVAVPPSGGSGFFSPAFPSVTPYYGPAIVPVVPPAFQYGYYGNNYYSYRPGIFNQGGYWSPIR